MVFYLSMRKVAVLIPSYCPQNYVESCLESLSRQTLDVSSYVVYIALNGCRYPYEKYVKDLLNCHRFESHLFYVEEPGVSRARNFLIVISSEPYLCFVDDDDVLSDDYLESLLNVSTKDEIGVSDVRCFQSSLKEAMPNYIGNYYAKLPPEESSLLRARKYFSSPCAKLIHRTVVGDARFNPRLVKGEDALFMAEISPRVSKIKKASSAACYYIRQRPGSATRSKTSFLIEVQRICYLEFCYLKMLFSLKYQTSFIGTRLVATILQLRKVF